MKEKTSATSTQGILKQLAQDNIELKKEFLILKNKLNIDNSSERASFLSNSSNIKKSDYDLEKNEKTATNVREKDELILLLKEQVSKLHNDKFNLKREIDDIKKQLQDAISIKKEKAEDIYKKLKEKEELCSLLLNEKNTLSLLLEKKNEGILSLRTDFAGVSQDRLRLRQENDILKQEWQKEKSNKFIITKDKEQRIIDVSNIKKMYDQLIQKNIQELKEKDTVLLAQGQEMISLRNDLSRIGSKEKELQKELEYARQEVPALKDQIHTLSKLIVAKSQELKSQTVSLQSQVDSYKHISEELKKSNLQLIDDIKKYTEDIEKYKARLEKQHYDHNRQWEEKKLNEKGTDDLALKIYSSNKELEILKQTILELTHKLKVRRNEEAKVLSVKNQDFDDKMRELTEAHAKRELELEYKIEELKAEASGLKSDMTMLKQKEQQVLDSIKNQFNSLL